MSRRTFLTLVFLVAFLVRLGAVLLLRDIREGPSGPAGNDDYDFHVYALNVAKGEGYVNIHGRPTSFRAPGYPFFLAGLYAVAGDQPVLVYLSGCLFGALSCVLGYYLAREVVGEVPARFASALGAVYLPHVWFATQYVSENLFVPLLALGLWLFLRALRGGEPAALAPGEDRLPARGPDARPVLPPVVGFALAGLVLGYAALVRPFAILLLPVLAAVLLLASRRTGPRRWLGLTALAVGAVLVVGPWTLRNQRVHGQFVLVATNGGSTFYGGNNDRVISAREPRYLGSWLGTDRLPHRDLVDAAPTEVEHDKVEWRLGLAWVREHPGKAVLLVPFKVARLIFWLPDFDAVPGHLLVRAAGFVPFLLLGLVGARRCLRPEARTPAWLTIHGVFLATVLTAVVFWGCPRFRDANAPLLMIYAGVGLAALRDPKPR